MAQPTKRLKTFQMDDAMREVLECPVCLKIPRHGHVYQCKRGHCICSDCQPKLTKCPICRVAMGKSPGRNFIVEKLLSKMKHGCKYAEQGCTFEETFASIEAHEEDCEFRLVNCSHLQCHTQVPLTKLLEHMEKDHMKGDFIEAPNPTDAHIKVSDINFEHGTVWKPLLIKTEGQHFFVQKRRSIVGYWHFWVNMLGPKKKCEDYIYTLKVFGQDKMEKVGFSTPDYCVPLDHSKEKVAELGTCLIFKDAQARRLLANGKIKYRVAIEPAGRIQLYSP